MALTNSTVNILGTAMIADSVGYYGGGLLLADNSLLALAAKMKLVNNTATVGGAIFAYDRTPLVYCSSKLYGAECVAEECFFRNLLQGHDQILMEFDGNEAQAGSVLAGGSIDRCTVDGQLLPNSGKVFDAITDTSNQPHTLSLISSQPFQVCLCENSLPHCGDSLDITTYPGKTFSIQAVTVSQRNGTVPGQWVNTLVNPQSVARLGVFEDRQMLWEICSSLTYTVYSNATKNRMNLYVHGTCSALDGSEEQLIINVYLNLHCPPAFNLSEPNHDHCICEL